MSDQELSYKDKYLYYKERCKTMEKILDRFKELSLESSTTLLPTSSPQHPVTSQVHQQDRSASPILGCRGAKQLKCKRRLDQTFAHELEAKDTDGVLDTSGQQSSESYDETDFEPGSNKWECIEDINSYISEDHQKQDETDLPDLRQKSAKRTCPSPLERLKTFKKFSGLELRNTTVSSKIHGVERRALPGWTCRNCSEYIEFAGLGTEFLNNSSRHRCSHERPRTPPDFFGLDMSVYPKHIAEDD